jgi:hypothetical protein
MAEDAKQAATAKLWEENPTPYEQLLIYQMLIAFAHGAGGLWIRRNTCRGIHRFCLYVLRHPKNAAKMDEKTDTWKQMQHGTQVLLRFEAIGRLAAQMAIEEGLPEIRVAQFHAAATKVMRASIETIRKRKASGTRTTKAVTTQDPGTAGGEECAWCPPPDDPDRPPPSVESLSKD